MGHGLERYQGEKEEIIDKLKFSRYGQKFEGTIYSEVLSL